MERNNKRVEEWGKGYKCAWGKCRCNDDGIKERGKRNDRGMIRVGREGKGRQGGRGRGEVLCITFSIWLLYSMLASFIFLLPY